MNHLNSLILLGVALFGSACAHKQPAAPPAADPTVSDGDKYHVLYENECVRMLRYHDQAQQKTHLHRHPDFVLYALVPFRRRLTFPDGTAREREFRQGEFAFMPAQSHVGQNIGEVDTDALIIELKPCAPR